MTAPRERQVAELMADGDVPTPDGVRPLKAREIGERLGMSAAAVRVAQLQIRRRINEAQRAAGYGDWC